MSNIKKILIADDEPDILEIIQFNLQAEGYEVITAKNGDEAIELAKKHQPDLIILDIMMPGKNGIEVCNILRLQPLFNDTLIVFLTALSDEGTEVRGLETEALTVPVDECATQSGTRQEALPPPDRQCGLIGRVAKGHGLANVVLHHRLADREPQFVVDRRRLKIRNRVARGTPFKADHLQSRLCKLQCHQRAGQADADRYHIDML